VGPVDRLAKIRSIIRRLEDDMDQMDPKEDQIPLLRGAIVEIIMAVGPQESGCRSSKNGSKHRERVSE